LKSLYCWTEESSELPATQQQTNPTRCAFMGSQPVVTNHLNHTYKYKITKHK